MTIWIRPTVATLSGVQPNVVVYHCIPEITSDKPLTHSPPIGHRDPCPSRLRCTSCDRIRKCSPHFFSQMYLTPCVKDLYKRTLICLHAKIRRNFGGGRKADIIKCYYDSGPFPHSLQPQATFRRAGTPDIFQKLELPRFLVPKLISFPHH